MKETTTFLNSVLQKIEKRIEEINATLEEGAKDVESMHEYYWENYTEMDEYGYENFDNQQALLNQINANQERLDLKFRMQKMLASPYFGRVDFCYDGEETPESFYIGIGNFAERKGMAPLIYDWRAPVSSLFYDYDSGRASYVAPMGEITGEITSKWQYKIRGGKLIYGFESDMKIDDEVLRQELGAPGENRLKNIIRTIQKEQNAIIRNTSDNIMVIQGVAGSGKTSVALHRIAYLLYHDRDHLKSSNVLILSPNSVFSDYISHILPELGEENIRETNFDTFAYHELKEWIYDSENRSDYMEQLLAVEKGMDTGITWEMSNRFFHEKQSVDMTKELFGFVLMLEDELVEFKDIHIRRWVKSAGEIQDLFYNRFTDHPLLSRMDVIRDYVIDEYETLTDRHVVDEELLEVQTQFDKMFLTTDLYKIYNMFLDEQGFEPLPDVDTGKRLLPYADVAPMLYLKYLLKSRSSHRQIKHLIIDEMQDYTYMQYRILDLLFSCKMTILGDKAQTMDTSIQDVSTFLPSIFGKNIRYIEMNRSYRNTMEIANYAGSIGKYSDIDLFERHGDAVEETTTRNRRASLDLIADRICSAMENETLPDTAAVLAFTAEEANDAYLYLRDSLLARGLNPETILTQIDKDSQHFKSGISVTTFYLAKGLEFEQVYLLNPTACQGPLFTQARYISATRALHGLHILNESN